MGNLIAILFGFGIIQWISLEIDPIESDRSMGNTEYWIRVMLSLLLRYGSFIGAFWIMYEINK